MPRAGEGRRKRVSSALSPASEVRAPAAARRPFLFLFGVITLPVLILDQLSKSLVRSHMALYQDIALIPNYLDLTYTRNVGAAFSLFTSLPPWFRAAFLLSLATIAIVVLFVLLIRSKNVTMNSVGFALILAGASGNLADRIVRGEVIDFVRAHYFGLNWPVFNVADSAISIGVVLVIIAAFFPGVDGD